MANRYFLLIFIIMGIGGLIASAYMTIETLDFLKRAVKTEAIVVDFVKTRLSEGWTKYPVFRFIDLNGEETYRQGTWDIQFEIGEKVEIFYDPENPSGRVYAGILAVWGPPLLIFGFGLSFFGSGLIIFLKWGDERVIDN